MPRVGSKHSIVRTPPATQRAIVTFCWLPPERRWTSRRRAPRSAACSTALPTMPLSLPQADRAPVAHRAPKKAGDVLADRALHEERLSAVGRDVDKAGADRVGRMAEQTGLPSTVNVPPAGRSAPAACRTARPGPGPRAPRRRAPRPGRGRMSRRAAAAALRLRDADARRPGSARRPPRCRRARALPGPRRSSPSISSTIRFSDPAATSTTPTVSPLRSTVARSQMRAISIMRCEMKMTDRPRAGGERPRARARSGSPAGRQSSRRAAGCPARSPARAPGRRCAAWPAAGAARGSTGSSLSMPSSASQWRNGSTGVSVRRRLSRMSRSGNDGRLLVDGDEAVPSRLGRGVRDALLAANDDAAGVGDDSAGQDLDQRALAGAVGAHQRVDLAGPHGERGVASSATTAPYVLETSVASSSRSVAVRVIASPFELKRAMEPASRRPSPS